MLGQMSIFEFMQRYEMYDGFEVIKTRTILVYDSRIKITKGEIFYLVISYKGIFTIAISNNYGGAFGFNVSQKQFEENFKNINKKIYPICKKIWNGVSWISNPSLEREYGTG